VASQHLPALLPRRLRGLVWSRSESAGLAISSSALILVSAERPISDKKQKPTQQLTAERATLAHAIAGQGERVARLEELDQAVRRATSAVRAACSVVDDAVEQEAQRAHMYGRSPDPTVVTEAARRDVEVTREALRAAKDALAEEVRRYDPWPQRIDAAALEVLRAELPGPAVALAARVERLQRDLFEAGSALSRLANLGVIPADDAAVRATIKRFETIAPGGWGSSWNGVPVFVPIGARALETAFAALKGDANAALPEVDADGG
jgi:hypothetical protein